MRDSITNLVTTENTSDFGTSTNNIENFGPTSPRLKCSHIFKSGIKIKDSAENVTAEKKKTDFGSSITNNFTFDTTLMFTSDIKIGVSATDFTLKNNSGTSTDHDNTIIPIIKVDERKNRTDSCTSTVQDRKRYVPSKVESPRFKKNTRHSLGNVITKSCDFGTSTDKKQRTISPTPRSIGIKFKDSETNVSKKSEFGTTTHSEVISDVQTPYASTTETKLLKPISSGIIEDSCSEFYGSCYSCNSPVRYPSSTKNTSGLKRSKLSCGGVHIHSYKEKQASEDVVFQGKWLKYKPKAYPRKKPYNPVTIRKVTESMVKKIKNSNSKHKISVKENRTKSEIEIKSVRKPRTVKPKQDPVNKEQIKKIVFAKSVVNTIRSNRNITKVSKNDGRVANATEISVVFHLLGWCQQKAIII